VQTLRKVRDAPDREALFHIMDGMSACGTKRTKSFGARMSATDPKRTLVSAAVAGTMERRPKQNERWALRSELTPQCGGLFAISLGLSANFPDDHEMLDHGMAIYDALYTWCCNQAEIHGWPPR
jgi:hypothetical protein